MARKLNNCAVCELCSDWALLETLTLLQCCVCGVCLAAMIGVANICSVLTAMLGGFTLGVAIGWNSSATYINRKSKNPDQNIIDHVGFIGALLPVGAMIVMVTLSVVLDRIGRKLTMLGLAPICVVSFLIPGLYINYIAWMVARFFMGFSCAAFCVASPIYVGEIAQKSIRGTLGGMFQLLLGVGICYSYALGLTGNMLAFSILAALAPVTFFVAFVPFPETPLFLLGKGKEDEAIKSLQWYRGKDYNITTEFYETKAYYEEIKSMSATPKDLVATKAARKSLLIALGLMLFLQLSGINIVTYYATDVFTSAGCTLNALICSNIQGILQVTATLVATLTVDKLGRRPLLFISLTGMCVCSFALGGWYIYLRKHKPSATLGLLPMLIVSLFFISFAIGIGPVPWIMIGELFPKHIKGMSGSLSGFSNWLLAFFVTITFPPMTRAFGAASPFFLYGFNCFLGIFFVFFIVIETKGKTLEEIQTELEK